MKEIGERDRRSTLSLQTLFLYSSSSRARLKSVETWSLTLDSLHYEYNEGTIRIRTYRMKNINTDNFLFITEGAYSEIRLEGGGGKNLE